jgi:hypothetical protein
LFVIEIGVQQSEDHTIAEQQGTNNKQRATRNYRADSRAGEVRVVGLEGLRVTFQGLTLMTWNGLIG